MTAARLARVVGVPGAVLMGLGSILGTGIFVSIGIAAGIAGPGVVIAIAIAAVVAICNGLSSAQLAASHPVSGGTYEYGYRYLAPVAGFVAGWMFLCAKAASAATAALGFAGYVLAAFGVDSRAATVGVGVAIAGVLTAVVAGGMRRSNRMNAIIVTATVLGLAAFVVAGSRRRSRTGADTSRASPTPARATSCTRPRSCSWRSPATAGSRRSARRSAIPAAPSRAPSSSRSSPRW